MQQGVTSGRLSLMHSPVSIGVLVVLILFGALLWAHQHRQHDVQWIGLRTANGRKVETVLVSPQQSTHRSALLYVHDATGSLEGDGNDIRHLAAAGFDVFSIQYDPQSQGTFDDGFSAELAYVASRYDSVAWIGYGLGANRLMSFVCRHRQLPNAIVIMSPTLKNGDPAQLVINIPSVDLSGLPILVLRGKEDDDLSEPFAERLYTALKEKGGSVELSTIPRAPQNLEPWRRAIFRSVGEYCRIKLNLPLYPESDGGGSTNGSFATFVLFFLPAIGWGIFLVGRYLSSIVASLNGERARPSITWRILAYGCITLVIAEGGARLVLPRLAISPARLGLAEKLFFAGAPSENWSYISSFPIWNGKLLGTLMEHVELSEYNRRLVNWEVSDSLFKEFVLTPDIQDSADSDLRWRRLLWEEFYPHVRRFRSTQDAARVAVRHLQERIAIVAGASAPRSINDMWTMRYTDGAGFQLACVATFRSIGIPSRLNVSGAAEYWDGSIWSAVPEPLSIN